MRTTVEIPDGIFRKAKAKAALRGESFKRYLVNALQRDLEQLAQASGHRLKRPLFSSQQPLISTAEEVSNLLEEEDREQLG